VEKFNDKMAKLAFEADGNVVGESFIIQPDKNTAGKLGVLFGIIEAYNINDNFLDGFIGAANDLKTEFYLPPFNTERGVERRFEEAISRANRRILAAVNQSVEEIDLRNISAAIGLFHGNHVYLSSVGRVKALFFRRKKNQEILIIDILSGNGETRYRPEPEKVFANILSGEMSPKDGLLLMNEEFLGFFAQKDLGEIILDNNAQNSKSIINETLLEKIAKKNFYGIILAPETELAPEPVVMENTLIAADSSQAGRSGRQTAAADSNIKPISGRVPPELITPRKIRQNVPTQRSIDQLLYTQVKTEKYLTPSLLPPWKKLLLIIWAAVKRNSLILGRQTRKLSLVGIAFLKDKIKAKRQTILETTAPEPKIHIYNEPEPEEAPEENHAAMEEPIIEMAEPDELPAEIEIDAVAEEAIDGQGGEEKFASPEPEQLDPPPLLIEEIKVAETKPPSRMSEKANFFLNGQIIKFLELKRGQQIVLIIGLIMIFLFSQSVVMIGRSSDKSQGSSINSDLANQIETQLDSAEAQNIFNDEVGAVASLRKARELLAQIPDKRLNKLLRENLQAKIDKTAGILQKIKYLENPPAIASLDLGQAVELVGLAKTGKVFWAFDNLSRSLIRFDTATVNLATVTTTVSSIQRLSAIDDKNLILSASGGLYKYDIAKQASSKTKPSKNYFQIKLPPAASPLIDPALATSTVSMSLASDIYSYYLDSKNGRIIVVDKTGVLKRQYYSSALNGAGSFAASTKDKKIWFYNSGKIFQIDLDF